jgi:hypothetical protein
MGAGGGGDQARPLVVVVVVRVLPTTTAAVQQSGIGQKRLPTIFDRFISFFVFSRRGA